MATKKKRKASPEAARAMKLVAAEGITLKEAWARVKRKAKAAPKKRKAKATPKKRKAKAVPKKRKAKATPKKRRKPASQMGLPGFGF